MRSLGQVVSIFILLAALFRPSFVIMIPIETLVLRISFCSFIMINFLYQVKLSEKLSHVQSLCIHEMIVRAFKHIVRAVIVAASDAGNLAISVAATLNLLLGKCDTGTSNFAGVHDLVWKWLETFLKKRYKWELSKTSYCDVRKYAILRGLCHKVINICKERDGRKYGSFNILKLQKIGVVVLEIETN